MQTGNIHINEAVFNSQLSFRPLVEALKKNITEGNPGMKKLYGKVVKDVEAHPELLNPITDLSLLEPHSELIEELLSAVFPPTTRNFLYGVALPFKFTTVYTSPLFKSILLKPGSNEINVPDNKTGTQLSEEKLQFAYGMILQKYLGYNSPDNTRSVHPFTDPVTGVTKYMELRIDARFIDVRPAGEMPKMPDSIMCQRTNRLKTITELMEEIPLDQFVFEGISVMRVNDVTGLEVISLMKNRLLDLNMNPDSSSYQELEEYIQSLIGIKDVKIGITPFFKVNGHYIYSEIHNSNSLLFKHFYTNSDKDEVSDCCKMLFRDNDQPVLFEELNDTVMAEVDYLEYYYAQGGRSIIVCPIKQNNELLGILEIVSEKPGTLKPAHITKLEPVIPLFVLALEKGAENLNNKIDRVIKDKFTAVQPSVEWKFTEVALNFIVNQQHQEDARIERISFPEVYPLYGAIDIRNSSTERSHSIQLDLIEQLEMAQRVLRKAHLEMPFPLLQEIEFKLDKYIASASDVLLSEEEITIHEFMQNQVVSIFNHLRSTLPALKNDIEHYFAALDPQLNMIYHHRKEYENSIARINDTLARMIDKEQVSAQKVYPHYFERYVTDGVEFNIYMGQSITPRKKFDELYLRNMKMWQLTVLAKAARVTHKLEAELSHPLKTTQLILSHSIPLSISFRTEERKFDVDGAYNIRYEIIKKRIDKVRIKDTNERLTQPGKIAIVYSQAKDAGEYMEYIEFLQNQKLIKPGPVEKLELEELQGVIGLKALRVDVNFDTEQKQENKVELSNITSQQLIGK
ncbi:MAG: hypothetical protein JNJ86_10995 [Chitinophagaceae bacterium]|jgi:hypothetical protein|nr:hypothetical protein [Chitinophagaceae bacterium]